MSRLRINVIALLGIAVVVLIANMVMKREQRTQALIESLKLEQEKAVITAREQNARFSTLVAETEKTLAATGQQLRASTLPSTFSTRSEKAIRDRKQFEQFIDKRDDEERQDQLDRVR